MRQKLVTPRRRLRVLVACESSGVAREAFRKLGHDAWSCDILPADDRSKFHIQGDAIAAGCSRRWDLVIAHPPCTYLCNSGVRWLHHTYPDGMRGTDRARWDLMLKAAVFFNDMVNLGRLRIVPYVAIENPVPHKYGELPPYTQIIQPWMFGHPETKATCLWLHNLPKLVPTDDVKEEMLALPKHLRNRIHYMRPGKDRWKQRSKTFEGVAQAMAEQWSQYILNQRKKP